MALILSPDDTGALIERANTYQLLGVAEEGLADVDKALSIEPGNAKALGVRGQIYESLGRFEDAVNDYKASLTANPRLYVARVRLQKMGIAPPPPPMPEAADKPVKGWWVSQTQAGHYIATNRRYPKMRVRLEMYGTGKPRILDWTLMKYSLQGIGLLRYRAGAMLDDPAKNYDYTAIIDLWKAKVVAVEPQAWGRRTAKWDWKMASVVVTDPDGVANEVTLRKAPAVTHGQGDQFWFNDGWWSQGGRPPPRPQPRRRQPSGGGLFDWLFN
jgi:tetratricopeptide (TPR) repeat protein